MYVIFVEMMKCFDSIYRNALWLKLYRHGISGKILNIIKDMYQKVISCVKHMSTYSEFFESAVGLRQGEVLSPILLSLCRWFTAESWNNDSYGIPFESVVLILLLFADDVAIIGKSPAEIQAQLDAYILISLPRVCMSIQKKQLKL